LIQHENPEPVRSKALSIEKLRWQAAYAYTGTMLKPDFFKSAQWIQADWHGEPDKGAVAPLLRRRFVLNEPVSDAVLYWTCIGLAEVCLDGKLLHEGVFLPGWTDTRKRLRVMTAHIGQLEAGGHVLEALLGDGWAVGHVATHPRQRGEDRPRFIARLVWSGGALITDRDWEASPSPVIENDLLMGETVDARQTEAPAAASRAVPVTDMTMPPLSLHEDPVVKRQETFPARKCGQIGRERIFDIGRNISGRMRIRVMGPGGASVVLRHAEVLQEDGSLYLENLRSAKATDTYILAGKDSETWEPRFTFHGFRYVSVATSEDNVEIEDLSAVALYSEMPRTGTFSCSSSLLNQLFENILWGQNGNFLEVPTDCPQRDERLGWTGDAQVFAPTAAFMREVGPFFRKWMRDVRDAQRDSGLIPCTVPDTRPFGLNRDGGPAWADAVVLIPWYLYEAYGDLSFLAENYDAMKAYMAYLDKEKVKDLIRCHPDLLDEDPFDGGFGDWLALDGSGDNFGKTPKDLIGTAFYARNAEILSRIAALLGKPLEAENWQSLHGLVRTAFQQRFLSEDGSPACDTQTACLLPLHFGLVDGRQKRACISKLVQLIRSNGTRIGTGFVGTPYLLHVLEAHGQLDLAYELLESTEFPSWLFPVTQGATTIWERWDGWHPERGFQNPSMNSFNHYAYGAVGDWMVRSLAGLAPDKPGYGVIRFRPRPGGSITHASASLKTRYGTVSISWRKSGAHLDLELSVPEGTKGILDVEGADHQHLPPGNHNRRIPLP